MAKAKIKRLYLIPILSKALGPDNQNIGLSLMISIYLIFWMEFAAAIRMNGPARKAVEKH